MIVAVLFAKPLVPADGGWLLDETYMVWERTIERQIPDVEGGTLVVFKDTECEESEESELLILTWHDIQVQGVYPLEHIADYYKKEK